jgi:hypothetical protein
LPIRLSPIKNRTKTNQLSQSRQQVRLVLKIPYLDPFRVRNFRCTWQASTGDDYFVVNLGGDIKAPKKFIEEVKASELCQNNKRR